ncbi:MAG TPA: gephyrin-like molybdotransferase Glp [Solirubrobacterales bacterium]|nr:gephyrin-like molybdotransferase Glp [Solirubrobacterales bacterium]
MSQLTESAAPLVELGEARRMVLERTPVLGSVGVPIGEALGMVLAEEVVAPEPVPAEDNSAMDGYAVRAADIAGASAERPAVLRVAGESRAGAPHRFHPLPRYRGAKGGNDADGRLPVGSAIAISTGAVAPAGADAVVPVEMTARRNGAVEVLGEVPIGANVRRAGEDIRPGERVLAPGRRIGPAELGALALAARAKVECARRPRVGIAITGDELIRPHEPMRPGAVRDANSFTVPALAAQAGAEVASLEHAPDSPGATRDALAKALEADVTVICGGVSVGRHDLVRSALAELGVEEVFWRVAVRPGKPVFFGVLAGGGIVFGLPGNPVSAMVTFLLFARPALLWMQGQDPWPRTVEAVFGCGYAKKRGRAEAVRCRLDEDRGRWIAVPTKEQGSHVLTSMLGAEGLAILPADLTEIRAGEPVAVELLPGALA